MSHTLTTLRVPFVDDFHIHLRQAHVMSFVVPHVYLGGATRVLVMPNTVPPILTVEAALTYRSALKDIDPRVDYYMTLYLTPELTVEEIQKAASLPDRPILGVKFYPKGLTTNSQYSNAGGLSDVAPAIFSALESAGLTLHLHGESPCCPSFHPYAEMNDCDSGLPHSILGSEAAFLPTLVSLHALYPKLRIVLEHVSTAEAISTVLSLGPTVACTVTAHHLSATLEDALGNPYYHCKPVLKLASDRSALIHAIKTSQSSTKIFLGSDSAPHTSQSKLAALDNHTSPPPGIYTSRFLLPTLAHLFDKYDMLEQLVPFTSQNAESFFGLPSIASRRPVATLVRQPFTIPKTLASEVDSSMAIVPFMAGKTIEWTMLE